MPDDTEWIKVDRFDGLKDEAFRAFDESVRNSGIIAERFRSGPEQFALLLPASPATEDVIWRLEPQPSPGRFIAVSQSVDDASTSFLRDRLSGPSNISWVVPRRRTPEMRDNLRERAKWFQRRRDNQN